MAAQTYCCHERRTPSTKWFRSQPDFPSEAEWITIADLLRAKRSIWAIAAELERSASTVSGLAQQTTPIINQFSPGFQGDPRCRLCQKTV